MEGCIHLLFVLICINGGANLCDLAGIAFDQTQVVNFNRFRVENSLLLRKFAVFAERLFSGLKLCESLKQTTSNNSLARLIRRSVEMH